MGYGLVFVFQAVGMTLAAWILTHVKVEEFKLTLAATKAAAESETRQPVTA